MMNSITGYAFTKELLRLQKAYPKSIQTVTDDYIVWTDGTLMQTQKGEPNKTSEEKLNFPSLIDQLYGIHYEPGTPNDPKRFNPCDDPGRIRYEPFFRKMYGNTQAEVELNLVTIYWMPKIFGNVYPLRVTTINDVDQKLVKISSELETLVLAHPEYIVFLENPGETYNWRYIANTHRLSLHSFGMGIDINPERSNYWQWDLTKSGQDISEAAALVYRNDIPWEIVVIFENYGFIWGGKWHHYDTMHFEYRPELFPSSFDK